MTGSGAGQPGRPSGSAARASAAQLLSWIAVGVGVALVLAAEYFLAMVSIAPFFGEYPTRTESLAVAVVMITMVVLEATLTVLAWRRGRRWLILLFAVPGLAALVAAVGLSLNTSPDDERTNPPWDTTAMLGGLNLALTLVVVTVGVVLATRRSRGPGSA